MQIQSRRTAGWNGVFGICLRIFPRLHSVDDIRMALVETLSHLEYLVAEGRLEKSQGGVVLYR